MDRHPLDLDMVGRCRLDLDMVDRRHKDPDMVDRRHSSGVHPRSNMVVPRHTRLSTKPRRRRRAKRCLDSEAGVALCRSKSLVAWEWRCSQVVVAWWAVRASFGMFETCPLMLSFRHTTG